MTLSRIKAAVPGVMKMDKSLMAYFCNHILTARTAFVRGSIGETLVLEMLKAQGYQARKTTGKCRGDLLVTDQTTGETVKVEVKTARADGRGKFQFCLKKDDRYGGTDCTRADVLVLLCVTKSGSHALFVMPSENLNQRALTISGNPHEYSGKYKNYRQYHNTLEIRTNVSIFIDRVATLRHPVYSEVAAKQ